MVTVALAGASGGLGAIILDAILETRQHKVIALSRSLAPPLSQKGADVRIVDYANHASLTTALAGVHTVITAIGGLRSPTVESAQLALLSAAKDAGVMRFAPSEFAFSTYEGIDLYAKKKVVWEATQRSGLEYTRFSCGLFMNVLGTGTPKGEEEALGGLRPWTFITDIQAGTADIPGDGNAKVTFTRTKDVGAFVAGALGLEKWEVEMGMVGEDLSYNEIVGKIEKVTGRKMLVKYNSVEELERMVKAYPEQKFYNQGRLLLARSEEVTVPPTLNEKVPSVKPWSVDEYLERYWGGVELGEAKWGEGNIIA